MTTLKEQPLSKQELKDLIETNKLAATFELAPGRYLVKHAERRREHEIYARAMQYMFDNAPWIDPTAKVNCQLKQYSDQMHCTLCGLTYDTNADDAPGCRLK